MQNGVVATLTNGKITSLENMAEEFRRVKSVDVIN